ncbi:hypothetical protein BC332_27341 [Capsicum chinense]|nr:hypothetical protein FXO38_32999 [Capsicum annuum]KAF3619388.1 hypothetical protein FXO37_33712 [Capsicum annuum]PHU02090.1 hypothetical protein BC332_27341 [Capsicum chinense]
MASSLSSSKSHYFSSKIICLLLVISLLLVGYGVEASRFGRKMMIEENNSRLFSSQHMKVYKKENAYKTQNLLFTMLPKGVPIPPSAPSKRHNAIED